MLQRTTNVLTVTQDELAEITAGQLMGFQSRIKALGSDSLAAPNDGGGECLVNVDAIRRHGTPA